MREARQLTYESAGTTNFLDMALANALRKVEVRCWAASDVECFSSGLLWPSRR